MMGPSMHLPRAGREKYVLTQPSEGHPLALQRPLDDLDTERHEQEKQDDPKQVVRRHETLREFFVRVLAANPDLADEAACRMEHAVPGEMVDRFVRFLEFIEMCPRGGPALLEAFRVHLEAGCRPNCVDRCPLGEPTADDRISESISR